MKDDNKIFSSQLSSLNNDNVDSVYGILFNRWRFDKSDEVRIDGELINSDEKAIIKLSLYDIRPKSTEIVISDTVSGFPLKEKIFIEQQIKKYESVNEKTKGSETNMVLNIKSEVYLTFLKKRLNKPQQLFDVKSFKSLFESVQFYNDTIKLLLDNKRIEKSPSNNRYKIVVEGQKEIIMVIVLMVILQDKGYFIRTNNRVLTEISTRFFNVKFTPQYFGKIKKAILENKGLNTKIYSDYTTELHFIK